MGTAVEMRTAPIRPSHHYHSEPGPAAGRLPLKGLSFHGGCQLDAHSLRRAYYFRPFILPAPAIKGKSQKPARGVGREELVDRAWCRSCDATGSLERRAWAGRGTAALLSRWGPGLTRGLPLGGPAGGFDHLRLGPLELLVRHLPGLV